MELKLLYRLQNEAEVFVFDAKAGTSRTLKDEVALAVTLTLLTKRLLGQNIQDMDAAVVAIGENFEATVLTTLNLWILKFQE